MSFNINPPDWLRWILLPVASIGTYVVANFLVGIVGSLLDFLSRSPWGSNFSTHVVAPGIAGYSAIAVIDSVAPAGRASAALAVAGCWMFVFGAATFFAFLNPSWATFLPIIFSVVGLVNGLMGVNDSNRQLVPL